MFLPKKILKLTIIKIILNVPLSLNTFVDKYYGISHPIFSYNTQISWKEAQRKQCGAKVPYFLGNNLRDQWDNSHNHYIKCNHLKKGSIVTSSFSTTAD